MIATVKRLIKNKQNRYKEDYDEMLGEYNREQETVKGYNGRQILELIQNCDDEGADKVLISLDRENRILTISNTGNSFSEKGYRSLFIPNLSSKTSKRKFIGNKGLGFRSIINWSNAVEIESNSICLKYSEEIKNKNFNALVPKEIQERIKIEEKLAPGVISMPFLSIPEIRKVKASKYSTSIKIYYKEGFYKRILKQIEQITPHTILFLKNIETIDFIGFNNKENIHCTKVDNESIGFGPKQIISFKDTTWKIFELEKDLPENLSETDKDEKEFYQIKIAIEKDFKSTSDYLYSFFPTNITLNQPYILHATFDLDSTRKQINDSDKNRFILERIVDFTIEVAKYYVDSKNANYTPLNILNYTSKADTLKAQGYYDYIDNAIKTQAIFPCIDNTYRSLSNVAYIGKSFGNTLVKIGAHKIFDFHLLPPEDDDIEKYDKENDIIDSLSQISNITELINRISATVKMVDSQRALFISEVIKNGQTLKNSYPNQFNLLTNEKGILIEGNEFVYTPITKRSSLKKPRYTKIHFINDNLFESLLFYLDYASSDSQNKSRFVSEKLRRFCNIYSYEPIPLAEKIISETISIIKQKPSNAITNLRDMHRCLFHNYKILDEETKKSGIRVKAPILTLNNKIKASSDVSLSKFYPTGNKTALIFKGIFKRDNFVASPKELGIDEDEDLLEIENYLKWININQFANYRTSSSNNLNSYFKYVKEELNITDSKGHIVNYKTIDNIEFILEKISLNQLILWIHFDRELKNQLSDYLNSDQVKNLYRGERPMALAPSYIKFIIKRKFNLDDFIIDENFNWANEFKIDYRAKEFLSNGVSKTNINEALTLLGAKDEFNDLSIEKVTLILSKVPSQYPDGRKSQSIYKKALSHYRENEIPINGEINLFADNGSGLTAIHHSKIYFSDRISLPKKLKKNFPILNFPPRAGGADAIKFFKVNDLKNLKFEVISHIPNDIITNEFRKYFEKLKPIILTFRINSVQEKKQQEVQANLCKKISIILCSEVSYQVKGLKQDLADFEFLLSSENKFFIKIPLYGSLEGLRKNAAFSESFADILSIAFDITGDKTDFKHFFRYDLEEVLSSIKNEFGEDLYQDARNLLGLSGYKESFWQSVFSSKGIQYNEFISDSHLEGLIKKYFKITFNIGSIDYEKLNEDDEIIKVLNLFNSIRISFVDFKENYPFFLSLEAFYSKALKNEILRSKEKVKIAVWNSYLQKGIEDKAKFLSAINLIENCDEFVNRTAFLAQFDAELNLSKIASDFISSLFGVLPLNSKGNPEKKRDTNLKRFNRSERSEIEQSERWLSLLYFDDGYEVIKSELLEKINHQGEDEPADNEDTNIDTEIWDSNLLESKPLHPFNNSNRGVYTPKTTNNKRSREIGKFSERLVYNKLKECYSGVEWVAKNNEGLHYDIRYFIDERTIKYVEVKTFDSGFFYLSRSEYEFGNSHKDNYEIWLVYDKKYIIPIKDFFTNKKYELEPKEFLVHLSINNQND
jgi:hypothetical protein